MVLTTALKQVFRKPISFLIAGGVAFVVFAISTWLPNLPLISQVLASPTATFSESVSLLGGLLGSIRTNFSVLSASYTIAIAILFGINVAMIVYYIRQRKQFLQQKGVIAGFGGVMSGFFGIGCAACGSFLLSSLLSFFGAAGLIALFPLRGQEFGILSIGILGFSIFLTAKTIQSPTVCKNNNTS